MMTPAKLRMFLSRGQLLATEEDYMTYYVDRQVLAKVSSRVFSRLGEFRFVPGRTELVPRAIHEKLLLPFQLPMCSYVMKRIRLACFSNTLALCLCALLVFIKALAKHHQG